MFKDLIKKENYKEYSYRNKKYPSVTTILSKLKSTKYLDVWRSKLGVNKLTEEEHLLDDTEKEILIKKRGLEESKKILSHSSNRGLINHSKIEKNYLNEAEFKSLGKEDFDLLLKDYLRPVRIENKLMLEEKVIWINKNNNYGFGGTFDGYVEIKKELKEYKTNNSINFLDKAILDWKNPLKVKYPKSYSKESGYYYPLTEYFLQTAAYTGAFNQMCGEKDYLKVNKNLVIVNPESSKKMLYIYYCDSKRTNFYWEKFKQILECFYENKEFDWDNLNNEIKTLNMIPQRLVIN